jgi:ketosteroid isomerase-like protein
MTIETSLPLTDVEAVQQGFRAVADGDLEAFAAGFHPAATWDHRNPDRLGGVKHGVNAIITFLVESIELTAGTLRPVPLLFMSDGAGHVAVLTRISGERPDGRTFEDQQILYFTVADGLVSSVDQYVGDPDAVTAFWS